MASCAFEQASDREWLLGCRSANPRPDRYGAVQWVPSRFSNDGMGASQPPADRREVRAVRPLWERHDNAPAAPQWAATRQALIILLSDDRGLRSFHYHDGDGRVDAAPSVGGSVRNNFATRAGCVPRQCVKIWRFIEAWWCGTTAFWSGAQKHLAGYRRRVIAPAAAASARVVGGVVSAESGRRVPVDPAPDIERLRGERSRRARLGRSLERVMQLLEQASMVPHRLTTLLTTEAARKFPESVSR